MARNTAKIKRGFSYDPANSELDIFVDGTEVLSLDATNGVGVKAGRLKETITNTDVDAQNNTFSAAQVAAGLVTHTSAVGGGTVTTDTAANYIANIPLQSDNQAVTCYYINDGSQTLTFASDGTTTVVDTGSTILTNEAVIVLIWRTSSTAVSLAIIH